MKKLRLTLIRANERRVHPFLWETNVSGIYPPLGLAYLAGAARRAGYPASIVDAHALRLPEEEVVDTIRRIDPGVVGITTTTFNWPIAVSYARALRRACPELLILVGGPQLSIYPDACLEAERAIDAGVVGEGDRTIVEILDRRAAGEELAGIPGTLVRRGDEVVRGPDRPPERDLDSLAMPALSLLPLGSYRALTLPTPFVSMVTTRGCPYRCRYCAQIYVGGKYREHGVDRMVEEFTRAVQEHGAKEIVYFDETFTFDAERVVGLCEGIMRRGLRARWNVRTRADLLDTEMLRAMKAAGCSSIHVGIEAGSERVRKQMNKRLDYGKALEGLGEARRLGLETRGYFMIGYPDETRAEIEETLRVARELPLDWASFTITTAQPGTPIYEEALEKGRLKGDYWRDYTLGQIGKPPGYFTSPGLGDRELESLLRKAYVGFYLRPETALNKLRNRRLWTQIPSIVETLAEIFSPKS
jgi:anaerobic magnesium-protoporphyrin IX monomethyl ester cyclase